MNIVSAITLAVALFSMQGMNGVQCWNESDTLPIFPKISDNCRNGQFISSAVYNEKVFLYPWEPSERRGDWYYNNGFCAENCAEMVTIHSEAENNFFHMFIRNLGMTHPGAWLGAQIVNKSDISYWDNKEIFDYSPKAIGEYNEEGLTCLSVGWDNNKNWWRNFYCTGDLSNKFFILCQRANSAFLNETTESDSVITDLSTSSSVTDLYSYGSTTVLSTVSSVVNSSDIDPASSIYTLPTDSSIDKVNLSLLMESSENFPISSSEIIKILLISKLLDDSSAATTVFPTSNSSAFSTDISTVQPIISSDSSVTTVVPTSIMQIGLVGTNKVNLSSNSQSTPSTDVLTLSLDTTTILSNSLTSNLLMDSLSTSTVLPTSNLPAASVDIKTVLPMLGSDLLATSVPPTSNLPTDSADVTVSCLKKPIERRGGKKSSSIKSNCERPRRKRLNSKRKSGMTVAPTIRKKQMEERDHFVRIRRDI